MKRPKDILSQPYHIQEYINYLERKNSSLHSVMCIVNDAEGNTIEAKSSNAGETELTKLNFDTIIAFFKKQKKKAPSLFE